MLDFLGKSYLCKNGSIAARSFDLETCKTQKVVKEALLFFNINFQVWA